MGANPQWMTDAQNAERKQKAEREALLRGPPSASNMGIADSFSQMAQNSQIQKLLASRGTQSTFLKPQGPAYQLGGGMATGAKAMGE